MGLTGWSLGPARKGATAHRGGDRPGHFTQHLNDDPSRSDRGRGGSYPDPKRGFGLTRWAAGHEDEDGEPGGDQEAALPDPPRETLNPNPCRAEPCGSPLPVPDKAHMNVLLIDESDSSARGALDDLGASGEPIRYEWAPDLASAVQRMDEPGIDIVLMGLALPDGWGSQALETVQAFSGAAPVVVMVGPGDREMEMTCRSMGAAEVVGEDELTAPILGRVLRFSLERARLLNAMRSLAMVDDLTDLYTLRGLVELGQHHLRVAIRMAQNVLLMYVATDAYSDAATSAVADVAGRAFRASDVVARVGQGEFAVLAMDADAQAAQLLEHRFREGIQKAILEGRTPSLRLRVGHAGLSELPRASVEDLVKLAKSRAAGAAPAQEEPAPA